MPSPVRESSYLDQANHHRSESYDRRRLIASSDPDQAIHNWTVSPVCASYILLSRSSSRHRC